MLDLRLGDWRDVLGGVECDSLITDPPYSPRTEDGFRTLTDIADKRLAQPFARDLFQAAL